MKILYFLLGVVLFFLVVLGAQAENAGSNPAIIVAQSNIAESVQIAMTEPAAKIISPKDGDTVGSTVEVKWNLKKANKAAHVHFYLDGKNLGPKQGNDFTLTDLKPGKHTIELQPATASHDEIGTKGSITIIVK